MSKAVLTDEQLAAYYGMTVPELKRWQEIRNRIPIRLDFDKPVDGRRNGYWHSEGRYDEQDV